MKKRYILFLFNLAIQYATAQPTVSSTPQIGDEVTSEYAQTGGTSIGAGGVNITWDYTNLIDSATTGTTKFVNASVTPYFADFPGAGLAAVVDDTLFSYYKTIAGAPAILGIESPSTKFVYAHPTSTLQYPFTYPDSFTDSVTLFLYKPLTGTSKLFDTMLVTGYGTLKLPGNIFNNVLQVRQINTSSGTIEIPKLGTFPVPPTLDTTYSYYENGEPAPLLFYSVNKGKINLIDYLKSATVLPLHFISFTAATVNGEVQLNWQTGDESNTNVFNIQRSIDGSSFNKICEFPASGSGSHKYSYTDAMHPGVLVVYYRLQETDIDGRNIYSGIVTCKLSDRPEIRLYPNPAKDHITITGIGNYSSLKIFNLSGQAFQGYIIKGQSITVPVTALPAGIYIVELRNRNKTTQLRFLKQ